jgi:hypothetical protein
MDMDQEGKALAINCNGIDNIPNANVYSINQYAGKAYRSDILTSI